MQHIVYAILQYNYSAEYIVQFCTIYLAHFSTCILQSSTLQVHYKYSISTVIRALSVGKLLLQACGEKGVKNESRITP